MMLGGINYHHRTENHVRSLFGRYEDLHTFQHDETSAETKTHVYTETTLQSSLLESPTTKSMSTGSTISTKLISPMLQRYTAYVVNKHCTFA